MHMSTKGFQKSFAILALSCSTLSIMFYSEAYLPSSHLNETVLKQPQSKIERELPKTSQTCSCTSTQTSYMLCAQTIKAAVIHLKLGFSYTPTA